MKHAAEPLLLASFAAPRAHSHSLACWQTGLFKSSRRSERPSPARLRVVAQDRKLLDRDHSDPLTQDSTRSRATRVANWRSSVLAAPLRQPSAMDWDMGSEAVGSGDQDCLLCNVHTTSFTRHDADAS